MPEEQTGIPSATETEALSRKEKKRRVVSADFGGESDRGVVRKDNPDEDSFFAGVAGKESQLRLAKTAEDFAAHQEALRKGQVTPEQQVRFQAAKDQFDRVHEAGTKLFSSGVEGLSIVADGAGGHGYGEEASQLAIERIVGTLSGTEDWRNLTPKQIQEKIREAVVAADRELFRENQTQHRDSASTLTMSMVVGGRLYTANVGDSRVYQYEEDSQELTRLTRDHSHVESLVRGGHITDDERYNHRERNIIYRSLGGEKPVDVDISEPIEVNGKVKLLTCCDGLWEMVRDPQLRQTLAQNKPSGELAKELVAVANTNGGDDNITAVVMEMDIRVEEEGRKASPLILKRRGAIGGRGGIPMAEDQDAAEAQKQGEVRPERSQLFFNRARERVKRGITAPAEQKPISEMGGEVQVDWNIVDRTDSHFVEKARQMQGWLRSHPDDPEAARVQEQIEVLSSVVGRDRNTVEDMKARMFGVGFLLNGNLDELPTDIGNFVDDIEKSRSGTSYGRATNLLEERLGSLPVEERSRVEALLKKRGELRGALDHFDRSVSGEVSLQERLMGFLGKGTGGKVEGVLRKGSEKLLRTGVEEGSVRRAVGSWVEKKLGFGYMGLRPREVWSTARLAMERHGADPIQLMAAEVAERREEIASEVAAKQGGAAEAGEGETAEEARARAGREEGGLSPEEQEALQKDKGLQEVAKSLRQLADEIQAGKIPAEEIGAKLAEILGIPRAEAPGAAGIDVEAEKAGAGEPAEAENAEDRGREQMADREAQKRLREYLGVNWGEVRKMMGKLANGSLTLEQFADTVFAKKGKKDNLWRKAKQAFVKQFREQLKAYGYAKEGDLKDASLNDLQNIFNVAIDRAKVKEMEEKHWQGVKGAVWVSFFINLYDEMKASVTKGLKEGLA